jgi:hypothetical protein
MSFRTTVLSHDVFLHLNKRIIVLQRIPLPYEYEAILRSLYCLEIFIVAGGTACQATRERPGNSRENSQPNVPPLNRSTRDNRKKALATMRSVIPFETSYTRFFSYTPHCESANTGLEVPLKEKRVT